MGRMQQNDLVVAPLEGTIKLWWLFSAQERKGWLFETQSLLGKRSLFILKDSHRLPQGNVTPQFSSTWQVILSRAWDHLMAKRTHVEAGHWGIHIRYAWLKKQAMCIGLFKLIKKFCQYCMIHLMLALNFLTLNPSEDVYHYVLVMVGHFTKFAVDAPTTPPRPQHYRWKHFSLQYGSPQKIHQIRDSA